MIRIAVDFNTATMDPLERVWIPAQTDAAILEQLRSGMRVVLHEDGLEAEAVAEYDEADQSWWVHPDPATYRDLPLPVLAGQATE